METIQETKLEQDLRASLLALGVDPETGKDLKFTQEDEKMPETLRCPPSSQGNDRKVDIVIV